MALYVISWKPALTMNTKLKKLMPDNPALVLASLVLALGAPSGWSATTSQSSWNVPGTYLWQCPTGVTNVQAECWGGGGGGGGVSGTTIKYAAGGGGGAYAIKTNLSVTPGKVYTITVPAGGGGGGTGAIGTNGLATSFTGDIGTVAANGGTGGPPNNSSGTVPGQGAAGGSGYDLLYPGGNGANGITAGNGGGGGSAASDLTPGTNCVTQAGSPTTIGSDTLHSGGKGGSGASASNNGNPGSAPGGGGGGARGNQGNSGGAGGAGQIILTWAGTNAANPAVIVPATYASVSDATPPSYNLTAIGTQDWQLFGDNNGSFTVNSSEGKIYASSISADATVGDPPSSVEQSTLRSAQTYTWMDGVPDTAGTNVDAVNNGFVYTNLSPVSFGVNNETITFAPGDTKLHTIHLYGYVAGDVNGLSLQFSNSLPGLAGNVFTTNPPLGDFDYSLMFQAQNASDVLTVVWTFAQTNTTGSQTCVGIQAATLSGTTPSAPPPRQVNWRIVPSDTNFPTIDTLVAGVVWGDTNVGQAVPSNPATQDCTKYVQAAMTWLSGQGGGTVFLPQGHYCFSNSLSLPSGVTLRGRWAPPVASQPLTNGTIFDVYADAGNTNANYFITCSSARLACGLRDLTFWYPNQNPTNWVYYPWTINNNNTWMRSVQNITLVNSYQGFNDNHAANVSWRGLYGTALMTGILVDQLAAVPRLEDLHLAPDYWVGSGFPGAPTNMAVLTAAIQSYSTNTMGVGIGLHSTSVSGLYWQNSSVSGYYYGIYIANLNGTFFGVVATNCVEALHINYTVGLSCVNCTFSGTAYGYHRLGGHGPDCYGCTFAGGNYSVYDEPVSIHHDFRFNNCTFTGQLVGNTWIDNFDMYGCNFSSSTPTNITLNGVGSAHIVNASNANCGPANVQITGGTPSPYLCTNGGFVPLAPSTFPLTYGLTRKPAKEALFDVTSTNYSQYGAFGDAVHDDTAAIQATITAAETNGGGIVFFPQGQYLITSPLVVSNGVELRGVNGTGEHAEESPASLLSFKPPTVVTNGPAFLTLGDGCGINGMNFYCPLQTFASGTFLRYPYLVECRGASNYLIGCASGNTSQSVDVNGARSALIDYCHFCGFTNILRVRGGATDCRYQNCHSQPWATVSGAKGGVGGPSALPFTYFTGDIFIAQDCTNLVITSVYSHIAHNFLTVDGNASVSVLQINGEQMQNGYVCKSGNGSLYLLQSGDNLNSAGDGTPSCAFWLQTNFTGTVTDVAYAVNISSANRGLWVENPQAQWSGYDVAFGDVPIWALKAGGQVKLVGSYLSQCSQIVPAGGSLVAIESRLASMPYVSQAGTVNFSANCISTGNSFIAANLADVPYDSNAITMTTNNLIPGWSDGSAWGSIPANPVSDNLGWQLASGTNFSFHVTSPYFTNGVRPNLTITASCGNTTGGSVTVSYDSTNGMKTLSGLSATVTDARFAAPNGVDIQLTASNCNPLVYYVAVYATNNLGVAPQLIGSAPIASFTATPTNGIRPLLVTFTNTSSGSITNLLWNFGDGQTTNTATGAVVAHTYQTNGTFTASLVANGSGGSSTNTQLNSVTVLVPNPPHISGISSFSGNALVLQGSGGPTNGGYYYWLRSSTNITLPLANWNVVATNPFDVYGNFSNQIPVTPSSPQTFYRLQMP
jgi:PKD repeat protein